MPRTLRDELGYDLRRSLQTRDLNAARKSRWAVIEEFRQEIEKVKARKDDDGDDKEALYRTLYYMPKGGDLHNHLSGAVFAEWWYELALAQEERGYEYYTKVRISNCREFGVNAFTFAPYFLLFRNISALEYAQLDECEKGE